MTEVPTATAARPTTANGLSRGRVAAFAVVALVVAVLAILLTREPASTALDIPRLVVLPLENLSSAEEEYFADGMTEEITSRLAAARGAVSGQGNPLRAGGNPLAGGVAGAPVSGTYSNGTVTVMLQAGQSGQYQGQISVGGEQWPMALQLQQDEIPSGSFSTAAGQFPVAMQVSGSTMVMESGGTTYQLQRQGGAAVGAQPANPLAAGGQNQSAGQGAVRGSGAGAGGGQLSDGTPLANEWVTFLRGKKITYMDSYSSGSSGGYSQRTDVFLCSSGEFCSRIQAVYRWTWVAPLETQVETHRTQAVGASLPRVNSLVSS